MNINFIYYNIYLNIEYLRMLLTSIFFSACKATTFLQRFSCLSGPLFLAWGVGDAAAFAS